MDEQQTTPNVPGAASKQLQQAATGFKQVQAYLEAIVVVDRYQIEDVTGGTHEFAPVLYARQQLQASVLMDRFVAGYASSDALVEAQQVAATAGKLRGLVAFLGAVLQDDDAMERLQELFQAIHPEILEAAQENAAVLWEQEPESHLVRAWRRQSDEPPTHVLDLFELDALVEGLVPFFARSATRIGRVLGSMAGATATPDSPPSSRPNPSPPSGS